MGTQSVRLARRNIDHSGICGDLLADASSRRSRSLLTLDVGSDDERDLATRLGGVSAVLAALAMRPGTRDPADRIREASCGVRSVGAV